MNIRTTLITSGLIAASLVTGPAHATLMGRDLDGNAATVYVPSTGDAWYFNFLNGGEYMSYKPNHLYALAVSPGDVGAANNNTVPEPQTLELVGLGVDGSAAAWVSGNSSFAVRGECPAAGNTTIKNASPGGMKWNPGLRSIA